MGLQTAQIAQQPAARQRRPRIPATSSVWNPLAGERWWPTTESELARYYLPTLSYDDDWSDEWVRLACERGVLSPQHEQDAAVAAPSSTRRRRWPLVRAYSDASRSADDSELADRVAEDDPPPYSAIDPVLPSSSSAAGGSPSPVSPLRSLHVTSHHDSTFLENLLDDADEPEPSSVRRASSAGSTDSGYVSILSRLSRHSSRHSQATVTSQEGEGAQVEQPQLASFRRGRLSISIRKKKGRRTSETTAASQSSLAA